MLVGAYPFEDPDDPKNFRKTIGVIVLYLVFFSKIIHKLYFCNHLFAFMIILLQRIMAVQYKIPEYVHISQDCKQLLSRIFVANSSRVCTILELLLLLLLFRLLHSVQINCYNLAKLWEVAPIFWVSFPNFRFPFFFTLHIFLRGES